LPVGKVMFIAAALLDRLSHPGFLLGLKDVRHRDIVRSSLWST
jgi:hypothetical protein